MTYSSGQRIDAADYNGFVNDTPNANINAIWNTAYGQTALATVTGNATQTVTATQWSTLVNTLTNIGAHQPTTITSRTAPQAGNTIAILANVNADISSCYTNRFNAYAVGTQYTAWTGTNSKTGGTSGAGWSITFTNTVTFANTTAANSFFNSGGYIKIQTSKSSGNVSGLTGDIPWNTLSSTVCGLIYITKGGVTQTIANVAYTGTTKSGGTGTPTILATTTGWDSLVANAAPTVVYKQFDTTSPYTPNYIQHSLNKPTGSTQLVITTLWQAADTESDPISGGTAASGATPGTAPCTIVTYFPPESTYLTNTWGTPTVAATTT